MLRFWALVFPHYQLPITHYPLPITSLGDQIIWNPSLQSIVES
ncbi:hypothetical protein [Fischerella thermalis]|nr:hypothetical protein [Fischerella thermalis]